MFLTRTGLPLITVGNIRVEHRDKSCFLISDIHSTDSTRPLWYEVPEQFESLITSDRGDAFVVALVVEAMSRGESLHVEAPLSQTLYRGLRSYQYAMQALYPELKVIDIRCNETRYFESKFEKRELGTGFTAGVDAFATLLNHCLISTNDQKLDRLVFPNSGTIPIDNDGLSIFQTYQRYLKNIADEVDLPILYVNSNLYQHNSATRGSLGARVASCALILQELFHTYLLQSASTYTDLLGDTDGLNPLANHLLSSDATRIVSDGGNSGRIEKLSMLANWPIARKYLHVCPRSDPFQGNCSHCTKCIATMIMIEMLGKCQAYDQVFDFSQFSQCKHEYLARNKGKPTASSSYLWREIVRNAEQLDYPLE